MAGYLAETIRTYDAEGWHWAFYAFRQDDAWRGLDYELGTEPLGDAYWRSVERGADPESLKHRRPNALWRVIALALARRPAPRQYNLILLLTITYHSKAELRLGILMGHPPFPQHRSTAIP